MSDPEARMQGDFHLPTRIIFGAGRVRELSDHLRRWGERALIVTDSGVLSSGALEPVEAALKVARIDYGVFSGSDPLPDEELVAAVAERYTNGSDFLLAAGGGRCIDTAKAARLALGRRFSPDEEPRPLPHLAAVPTTPGSGSEIHGQVAIHRRGRRQLFRSLEYIPDLALYDPCLTVVLPARITAAAGAGVTARCVGILLQERFHPMADAAAEDAIRISVRTLPAAVSRGYDLAARTGVMTAALLGGVAAAKGRGAVVALGQALSSIAGVQHGVAQALVAPVLLETDGSDEARERVARALELADPADAAGALRRFFRQLGLPRTLQEVGVPHGMTDALVALALEDWGDDDYYDDEQKAHDDDQKERRRRHLSEVLARLE